MARLRRLLRTFLILTLVAGVATTAAFAAFTGSKSNPDNQFQAGTVAITDDDDNGSTPIVSLAAGDGGDATTGCIEVHYTGTLPAEVRLRGSTTGPLASKLNLRITRGTGVATFPNCSFTPDATDYIGQGAGVVYDGTLASIPSTWASGVLDPPGASRETWTQNEKHVYRIRVSVPTDGSAQGVGNSTAQFTWEARDQ